MKYFVTVALLAAAAVLAVHAESDSSTGDDSSAGEEECRCRSGRLMGKSTCEGNTATGVQKGCRGTNKYLQCDAAVCSEKTCPVDQVWSGTACDLCPKGKHVRADGQRCVCDIGTKLNRTTDLCSIPCPTGSNELNDSCKCPRNTLLDWNNNTCKVCPPESTQRDDECKCNDATPRLYFQASTWSCIPCPGTVQTVGTFFTRQKCTCTGAGQIFDRKSVTCFTCPAIAPRDKDGDECKCTIRGQKFNMKDQTCNCEKGRELNAAKTACERITTVAPPTTAASATTV
jgi:hypothetical protein